MSLIYRPLVLFDPARPDGAFALAGGWCWFAQVEVMRRDAPAQIVPAADIPAQVLARLTAKRAPITGLSFDAPRLMGIVNVTPDSFSDGGQFEAADAAVAHGVGMAQSGAAVLDIGGESTRPGADFVSADEEIARVVPVIKGLRAAAISAPISIDTRKADVAEAALNAGADMINDVSAMAFDPDMAALACARGAPICLMHAQGEPKTMQQAPRYDDVLFEVYDHLEARIAVAEAAGIKRAQIIVDPGIGFGKTQAHNLALLARLSAFHGLGCAILLGASRKRFIGAIGWAEAADMRMPGSVAVALAGIAQGVQMLRVHDMAETDQAVRLWMAATGGVEE
ncbi:MAG: dihydropteroate synthase [Halocynthiibacter sp.]|jgi:dihydropteroate synthase